MGASSAWALVRLPCCCHSRLRFVAARSSQDLACWRRATVSARRKQASAWAASGTAWRRSKVPWSRYPSASRFPRPVASNAVSASARKRNPSSTWPACAAVSASSITCADHDPRWPVARTAAMPWCICARLAAPRPCRARPHAFQQVPNPAHSGNPCAVATVNRASAWAWSAGTSRR
jgi:hypothetical protein